MMLLEACGIGCTKCDPQKKTIANGSVYSTAMPLLSRMCTGILCRKKCSHPMTGNTIQRVDNVVLKFMIYKNQFPKDTFTGRPAKELMQQAPLRDFESHDV